MSLLFECWWDSAPELQEPRWREGHEAPFGPFTGVTTNPMLLLDAARRSLPETTASTGWELYLACAERSANHLASLGASMLMCVQLDARLADDAAAMVVQAKEIRSRIPNAMIKVPLSAAGIETIGALAAEGVPINGTWGFSVAQFVAAARAIKDAGHPEPRPRHLVSCLQGRLGDLGLSEHLGKDPRRLRAAEAAVFDAAYRELEPYRDVVTLMGASLRPGPDQECWSYSAKAGKNVLLTLPPSFLDKVGLPRTDADYGVVDETLYQLALSNDGVRRYAEADGFTAAEFDLLPPLVRTRDEAVAAFAEFDVMAAGSAK
ncbi:transaldolase family protein [Streptomyces violascens]|uniref:transaldolase family protein n=1 Tax=Streptomyces violascens TaxID=67381 RepID=UPI0036CB3E92